MKIEVWCDSGANIHSCRKQTFDIKEEWGITDEEWNGYTEDQKYELAKEWAHQQLNIGFQEI